MKVFYFTGTGNSLAVAKQFKGELVSIPQAVRAGQTVYEDEAIGVVFPLYCMNPPKMVREFLHQTRFKTKYLFAISTCGSQAGAAMPELQKMVKTFGYQFDYMNTLLMVNNFLPNYEINKEIAKLSVKKTEENLKRIVSDVSGRKHNMKKATIKDKLFSAICVSSMKKQDKGGTAADFLVNENCVGCGICAKVCPAANITVSGKVAFGKRCEGCYACIHACPQNAIHLKNEKSAVRWRNPNVSLEELICANQKNNQ